MVFGRDGDDPLRAAVGLLGGDQPGWVGMLLDEGPGRQGVARHVQFAEDEQERFYLARRWRQDHQLPERVFYRVPVELKPAAADFSSIVLINLFAKHIRQTQAAGHTSFTVTEMLPDLDQLWLTDRHGQHYSAELRIIAYDSLTVIAPS